MLSDAVLITDITELCSKYSQHTGLTELGKLIGDLDSCVLRLSESSKTFEILNNASDVHVPDITARTTALEGFNDPFQVIRTEILDLHWSVKAGQWLVKDAHSLRTWPLSVNATQRWIERIKTCSRIMEPVLEQDQDVSTRLLEEQFEKLSKLRSEDKIEYDQRKKINEWIAAPDYLISLTSARKKRHPLTGLWLIDGVEFNAWLSCPGSTLWLYGKPGCGKTVLCSFAIDKVLSYCHLDLSVAIAYFFFNFQDERKTSLDGLVRSLIQQLSMKNGRMSKDLDKIFQDCQEDQRSPSFRELQDTLHSILRQIPAAYILVDAVDECIEHESAVDFLCELGEKHIGNLHLMVTSRPARQFDSILEKDHVIQVPIIEHEMDFKDDVSIYIKELLYNDPRMRRWPESLLSTVETTLRDKADGVFHWVECQLDIIRRCGAPRDVRRALGSLPKTLDETYARILANVTENHEREVIVLLQWLTYSSRPLRIEEIAEVFAIRNPQKPRLDPDCRIADPQEILSIFPGLVTTTTNQDLGEDGESYEFEVLVFTHFAVKEYLTSERCYAGACRKFSVRPTANNMIAESCIGYLFSISVQNLLEDDFYKCFPLSRYASREWPHHVKMSQQQEGLDRLDQMIDELLNPNNSEIIKWLRMFDPDKRWSTCLNAHKTRREVCSGLYYASSLGLLRTVKRLLQQGADINQTGGSFGSALQAAAYHGHKDIVVTLIENGADCTIRAGHYGTALKAAKFAHRKCIVKFLEEHDRSESFQDELPGHIQLLQVEKEPFEVIDRIGGGGSGIVEIVRILSDGRICARKTCRTPSQVTRKRFFEEVRIMQKLHHIHVVEVLNSYSRGKTSSILLSPLADMDLGDFLENLEGELSEQEREEKTELLVQWTMCLAEGLCYIHSKSVKHKDIKPQNLLVHGHNILYTDFGIAHDFEGSNSVTADNTGMTRRYSAPEVVAGDERSRPADIFSLGCVYLEMLGAMFQRSLLSNFNVEDEYAIHVQDNRTSIKEALVSTRDLATELIAPTSEGSFIEVAFFPKVPALTFDMLAALPHDRPKASQLAEQLCATSSKGASRCCGRAAKVELPKAT